VAILEIKIQDQLLDLYDTEKIVQSFSLINIEDITKRESEYSNTFKVPKTNKNLQNLGYADFLNSDSLIPYSRLNCEILIDGFIFKKGFISIENIDEDISLRFFTGNAGFYEIIKNKSINQIDTDNTPSLKTIWNLSNVISKRNTNEGLIFALIDYNGMPTSTTTIDARLLLPSFYRKTLIKAIVEDAGYTLINNIENSLEAYNNDIIPTAKNNLSNTQETIDANTYVGLQSNNSVYAVGRAGFPETYGIAFTIGYPIKYLSFNNYVSGNVNLYTNNFFIANVTGTFNINVDFDLSFIHKMQWRNNYNNGLSAVPKHKLTDKYNFYVFVNNVPIKQIIEYKYDYVNSSIIANNTGINNISYSTSFNQTINVLCNKGDLIRIGYYQESSFYGDSDINFLGSDLISIKQLNILNNSNTSFQLSTGLAFNGIVSCENCLSDIKQSDFFKDTCIRYGVIPIVDEDNKKVTLFEFSEIKSNIQNALDWSNKLDETKDYNLEFKIDSYAQRNLLNHKEDKFVLTEPEGTNGIITINNQNLNLEKKIYESPFAASTNVERLNGKRVMYIDLHDGVSLTDSKSFKNGVTARTGYVEKKDFSVTYTDGTTNTIVSNNIPLTWFIDNSMNYSAGFQSNLLEYSLDLINILQSLKIVKCEIRLNILDIINLNYFYPIYIDEFNSYFFLSKISQFDYTSNDSTSVELIKLN
jgi:hypothetical protein